MQVFNEAFYISHITEGMPGYDCGSTSAETREAEQETQSQPDVAAAETAIQNSILIPFKTTCAVILPEEQLGHPGVDAVFWICLWQAV